MSSTNNLYNYFLDEDFVPRGLPMVGAISGFTDAGSVVNQFAQHIFQELEHEIVIQFTNDELLDYRSRRPVMYFEKDHIESYEPQVLGIYLVEDEAGEKFLFLNGYEPDFRWDGFSDAFVQIIESLQVASFTWIHSIPFPIPHTRPIGVTVSGNRKDLINDISEWRPQTEVPGNVLHLLEYRLTQLGLPTVGFVLLVPHYLSESEYPSAALKAFEQITIATGLVFPTDEIRDSSVIFDAKINQQVAENGDLAKMVNQLEAGYLSESSGPIRAPMSKPKQQMPSADEIANELEDYLASRRRNKTDEEN